MDNKQIQIKDKQELESKAELTKTGPVFLPSVDIFENKDALVLIADMPGVGSEGIDIHLEDNELTIRGEIAAGDSGLNGLYQEYQTGDYFRRFTLSNIIDQDKIDASIKNGVLKIVLPKAAAAKPRKIQVKAV